MRAASVVIYLVLVRGQVSGARSWAISGKACSGTGRLNNAPLEPPTPKTSSPSPYPPRPRAAKSGSSREITHRELRIMATLTNKTALITGGSRGKSQGHGNHRDIIPISPNFHAITLSPAIQKETVSPMWPAPKAHGCGDDQLEEFHVRLSPSLQELLIGGRQRD